MCALVLAFVVSVAACSDDDGSGAARDAGSTAPGVTATTVPVTEPDVGADTDPDRRDDLERETADGTDATEPVSTAPASGPSDDGPDPLPDVGVPGLDDEEVLCRSWSRIAGSFQAVAVAWAFGEDERSPYRLETAAAHVVVTARDEMVAAWPDDLADERDAVTDGYLGPFVRRAERALAALDAAGVGVAELDALDEAWITALSQRAPDEPVLDVVLAEDLDELVAAAADEFAVDVPPVPQDPSLVTEVAIPRTEAFVAERCPDRGTLAGSDPVG